MANFTLFHPYQTDFSQIISVSSEVAGLPGINVQNREPTKKWRTTVNNYGALIFDFLTPSIVSALTVVGANWSNGGHWRLRAANSVPALTTTPVYDTGGLSAWNSPGKPVNLLNIAHWINVLTFNMGVTPCRYFLVEFGDSTPASSYLEFGRVYVGRYFQPAINIDIAGGITYEPLDVQQRTPFGQVFTDPRPYVPRRLDVQMSMVDSDETTIFWSNLTRFGGNGTDVIVSLDPAANSSDFATWTFQGHFVGSHFYSPVPFWNNGKTMWSAKWSFLEKL